MKKSLIAVSTLSSKSATAPAPSRTSSAAPTQLAVGDVVSIAQYTANAQIKYAGPIIGFDPSEIWYGLEFPDPVGKCDGKVRVTKDGVTREQRYFQCAPNCGIFMKASNKSIAKLSMSVQPTVQRGGALPSQAKSSISSSVLSDGESTTLDRRMTTPQAYVRSTTRYTTTEGVEPQPSVRQASTTTSSASSSVEHSGTIKTPTATSAVSSPTRQARSSTVDDIKTRLENLENAMQKITSTGADEAATILKLEKRVALLESYLRRVPEQLETLEETMENTLASQSKEVTLLKKALSEVIMYSREAQRELTSLAD